MNTKEGLTCRQVVELVTDYLEGALSEQDHERFENHLIRCGGCVIYMAQFRATINLLRELGP